MDDISVSKSNHGNVVVLNIKASSLADTSLPSNKHESSSPPLLSVHFLQKVSLSQSKLRKHCFIHSSKLLFNP